jgi:hypothetical protein
MINRLGVTRLLFTLSTTVALFFGAAFTALAQKPDVNTPEPAPMRRSASVRRWNFLRSTAVNTASTR